MLSFFPRAALDEIWDLIESVSEGFPTFSNQKCKPFNVSRSSAKTSEPSQADQLIKGIHDRVSAYVLLKVERNTSKGLLNVTVICLMMSFQLKMSMVWPHGQMQTMLSVNQGVTTRTARTLLLLVVTSLCIKENRLLKSLFTAYHKLAR